MHRFEDEIMCESDCIMLTLSFRDYDSGIRVNFSRIRFCVFKKEAPG